MKRDSILLGFVGLLLKVALIFLAVLLIRKYAVKSYEFGYRIFKEPAVSSANATDVKKVTINLTEGVTPKALGDLLESKGLIRDSKLFIAQYYCSEYKDELKPGTYVLRSTMTAEEMFAVMAGQGEEEGEE